MAIFVISDLVTQEFTFENIKFKKLTGSTTLERRWREQFRATFIAEADDNLAAQPIMQNEGLTGVIHDICLLLSLAESRSINCPYYNINGMDTQRFSSPRGQLFENKLVKDANIESYLSTSSRALRETGFLNKTGFVPSAYYFAERYHHKPGDVGFMLTWIALEILANTYAEKHKISNIIFRNKFKVVKEAIAETLEETESLELSKEQRDLIMQKVSELNRLSIRSKISKLRDNYRWDFIPDNLLSDCIKVRNYMMHLGNYGNFNRTTMPKLYSKLATSVNLMLIDLLKCSEYVYNLSELKEHIKSNG